MGRPPEELGVEMLNVRDDDGTARRKEPGAVMPLGEVAERRPGVDVRAKGNGQHALCAEAPQCTEDTAVKLRILRRECRRDQERDGLAASEVAEEALRVVVVAARVMCTDAEAGAAGCATQGIDGDLRLAALDVRDTCAHGRADADAFVAAHTVLIRVDEAFFLHSGSCFLFLSACGMRLLAQIPGDEGYFAGSSGRMMGFFVSLPVIHGKCADR